MARRGDFYEDDEPIEDLVAAFDNGEHVVTAPPPTTRGTAASGAPGCDPSSVPQLYEPAPQHNYYRLSVRETSVVAASGGWTPLARTTSYRSSAVPSRP